LESGKQLRLVSGHLGGVRDVAFSADGQTLLSIGQGSPPKLWFIEDNDGAHLRDKGLTHYAMAFAPDGRTLLTGAENGRLRLWDLATGHKLREIDAHAQGITRVAILPDGRTALSSGFDNLLKLWDLPTGQERRTLVSHETEVTDMAHSADGRWAISRGIDPDRSVRIWDLQSGDVVRKLDTPHAFSLAVSPDGKQALVGSSLISGEIQLWDLMKGSLIRTIKAHGHWVSAVAFGSDGQTAVSGSWDQTIKLWHLASTRPTQTFLGSADNVNTVALSADGRLVFSGGVDGLLRIWNVTSGQMIRAYSGYAGFGKTFTISSDGRCIAFRDPKQRVRILRFDQPGIYHNFDTRLPRAREALKRNEKDPAALITFGEYYAFRGKHDWAAEFLEQTRNAGGEISSLTLGRCYWQLGKLEQARREFQLALERSEAPADYLKLCLEALAQPASGPTTHIAFTR
jgi:WD40 repeat protein